MFKTSTHTLTRARMKTFETTHTYLEETDLALQRRLYLVRKLLGDHHVAAGAHGTLAKQVLLESRKKARPPACCRNTPGSHERGFETQRRRKGELQIATPPALQTYPRLLQKCMLSVVVVGVM